jgi:hypothetical protein
MRLFAKNRSMRIQAQTLLAQIRDPALWGTGYDLEATHALAIWKWAERSSEIDIQAEIAGVVATQYLCHHYNTAALNKKLKHLAEEAQASARWKNYAGFLEGLSVLEQNNWEQRQRTEEELCVLYARLADTKRQIWHLDTLAAIYIRLHAFEQAKRVLLETYQISREARYDEGIGHSLLRIGQLLDAQGKHIEACRFMFHAKVMFETTHSLFYVTARDILNRIAEEYTISKAQYETDDSLDVLMDRFIKA